VLFKRRALCPACLCYFSVRIKMMMNVTVAPFLAVQKRCMVHLVKKQLAKMRISLSILPTLLATSPSSLMSISPLQTKLHISLSLTVIIIVNFSRCHPACTIATSERSFTRTPLYYTVILFSCTTFLRLK